MFLSHGPIVAQFFLVKLGPIQHQSQGAARKFSFNYLQRLYGDLCFVFTVYRMEMGWRVIVIVHPNDDPKKDAERWHGLAIPGNRA